MDKLSIHQSINSKALFATYTKRPAIYAVAPPSKFKSLNELVDMIRKDREQQVHPWYCINGSFKFSAL